MGNHLRQISEGRTRYTVRTGDTPGNIAGRMLGDVRYADLIVTINRVHAIEDETKLGAQTRFMAYSRIDLPSESEMEIYGNHYFAAWEAKKSWLEESATSVSSFLGKMRHAAHRGAEKLNTHSNPLSMMPNTRMNRAIDQTSMNLQTGNGTVFNGVNQQRIFDAFIDGTR
jgi:hypothetical protein